MNGIRAKTFCIVVLLFGAFRAKKLKRRKTMLFESFGFAEKLTAC